MNDIFLSYAAPDRAVAQKFADAFEALGWSVWWDREIPFGKPFDQVIEEELNAAQCVVVLWTSESVRSRWVKTEAAAAADRDRLVPVLLEDVQIPLEFRRVQTAMLHGWDGDRGHADFLLLTDSLKQMVGPPAARQTATTGKAAGSGLPALGWRTKVLAAAAVVVFAVIVLWQGRNHPETIEPGAVQAPQGGLVQEPTVRSAAKDPSDAHSAVAQQASGATAGVGAAGAITPASAKSPYRIRIGDTISDGVPGAGAGHIENPGVRDTYVFEAKAGERVYFRLFEYGKGMELIEWKLSDPDGATVFESRLGYGNAGARVLTKPGAYTMTVGSDRVAAVGTYRMKLFGIPPPQRFTVKIGEIIGEDTPAAGAGTIESPGTKDVYTFTATPGQRVYFRMFEHSKDMHLIEWKVVDSDAAPVFDRRLGYGDPGVHVLKKGGTYTMSVGSEREPGTGTYRLQLTSAD